MIILGLLVLLLLIIEGVQLWRLQRQIETYKSYWLEQAKLPIADNAVRYIALGDSTAQGIGASKPQNGYVGLIADRLAQKTGRPVHVTNLSVTGAKLQDVIDKQLPALQQMDLPKDTVMTLAIGSNNIRSYDNMEFRTVMDQILSVLPPQTVVGDIPYFGGGRANSGETNAIGASAIIAELARKHSLRLAPLREVTKEGNSIRIYAADFFHPNDRGYKLWAEAFWQILDHDGGI